MEESQIKISTPYITLGQLLKLSNIISNGGEAKFYLATHNVFINSELDSRRGRKIYPGDLVEIEDSKIKILWK